MNAAGHRQRLKDRFVGGDAAALTERALLELLLTFALPQQDVQPLAETLIRHFGTLDRVLAADFESLCAVPGLKAHTATLVKLVYTICQRFAVQPEERMMLQLTSRQPALVIDAPDTNPSMPAGPGIVVAAPAEAPTVATPHEPQLFTKSLLQVAIGGAPTIPESARTLDEVRTYLRDHMPFNATATRQRYAAYVAQRLFPEGAPDHALLRFARRYVGQADLRDVAFYRFCRSQPLMREVMLDVLAPAISTGSVARAQVAGYLAGRFPQSRSIRDATQAVVETLAAAQIARLERGRLEFGYRSFGLPAFTFVLFSEFSEPGMYPIERWEGHPMVRALLWNPDQIGPMLYELRNRHWLSKVTEIDRLRQFTTHDTLEIAIDRLLKADARS